MNYKPFLLSLLLLKAFPSFALSTDTVKIFYGIDKYGLSVNDKIKIRSLVDSLKVTDTVKVLGYADYLGNGKDNLVLSANRASTIKNYILSLRKTPVIITEGKGEISSGTKRSGNGEPQNRRVDIIKTSQASDKQTLIEISNLEERAFKDKINNLARLGVGSSLSLEELTFQAGRHVLNREAVPYAAILLDYLKKHGSISFVILGHICCDDKNEDTFDIDSKDYKLSTNRAKVIYDYFLKNGIKAERMTFRGLGSSKPKVWPEKTGYDKYLNRRVEILITGK